MKTRVSSLFSLMLALACLADPLRADDAPAKGKAMGYVVIPVKGIIGHHFTDDILSRCLKAAEDSGIQIILLEIDSAGGLNSELEKITKRLVEWQQTGKRVIALVRPRALSAGAIIAIACKEIVMAPASTIGATTDVGLELGGAYKMKKDAAVEISDRAVAQFAGHDTAFAEAIGDASLALWRMKDESDKPTMATTRRDAFNNSRPPREGATRIKEHGRILTLTARDALDYGLAVAIVKDNEAIGPALKIEPWYVEDDKATKVAVTAHRLAETADVDLKRLCKLVNDSLTDPFGTTVTSLARQLSELRAAKAATARIGRLIDESPYLKELVDDQSIDAIAKQLEERIKQVEGKIEEERNKKKK